MTGFLVIYPSSSLFVPHELAERILHYLKVDIKSLTNSALVCRSWASASRSCLFEKMTLMPAFAQRFQTLGTFFAGTSTFVTPPAAVYCRTLHIRDVVAKTKNEICPFLDSPSALQSHPLHPLFSILTTLTISNSTLPSLGAFMIFISAFTTLQTLCFDNVSFNKRPSNKKFPSSIALSSITELSVRNLDLKHFFAFVNEAQILGNVARLRLGPVGQWDVYHFAMYLHRVSSNLEYLATQFKEAKGEHDYICGIVPIVECPLGVLQSIKPSQIPNRASPSNSVRDEYRRIWGLKTTVYPLPKVTKIQFEDFFNVYRGPMQASARFWAPRILTSMILPAIERLELGLTLERAGQLDQYEINWRFLDYALSSEDYVSLQKLVFVVDGIVDLDNLGDLVSARLPLLTERGILEFCRMERGGL
ncbi:hypothetical protein BJ165DRAFT_734589 [Panaeolus papilionaceus]|nr:hypothetical protein BJ165DRAFT_734589 [Panaeolus papilionaceus]